MPERGLPAGLPLRSGHAWGIGHGIMTLRAAFATITGLLGLALYIGVVVALGDHVLGLHWLLQALYYLVAGLAWAFPAAWLMRWAARRS